MGELQRQLDEARAMLDAKDQHLAELAEERQAMADELSVLKGMGGAGVAAGAAAAELAGASGAGPAVKAPVGSSLAPACGLVQLLVSLAVGCVGSTAVRAGPRQALTLHPLCSPTHAACLPVPPASLAGAALDLSGAAGGDEKAMKAIEQRISAVLAEKSAMESKLARLEAAHRQEMEAFRAVSGVGGACGRAWGGTGVEAACGGSMWESVGPAAACSSKCTGRGARWASHGWWWGKVAAATLGVGVTLWPAASLSPTVPCPALALPAGRRRGCGRRRGGGAGGCAREGGQDQRAD